MGCLCVFGDALDIGPLPKWHTTSLTGTRCPRGFPALRMPREFTEKISKSHMESDCKHRDEYEEVIQKMFMELIKNELDNYDSNLSFSLDKESLDARYMENPTEWPNTTDENVYRKKTGILQLGINFFHELRLLLWKLMHILRRNEDLRDSNMDEVMSSNTLSRSEDMHLLETILRMHYVLLQEQEVMQLENINRKTRYCFYNVQPYLQNRMMRNRCIISEIINEILGRLNCRRLMSTAPPHIHLVNVDGDGNGAGKECPGSYEWKDTKDEGNYHSERLKKLNNGNSRRHKCLLAYLMKLNQSDVRESIGYYPLSLVFKIFMDEFCFEWKKTRSDDSHTYRYPGVNCCQPLQVEDKLFQYYPMCHFCKKNLALESQLNHCCVAAEMMNLIKKKVQDINSFQIFASLNQDALRKIAEKLEKYRIKNMVNIIQSFLRGTAQKTKLSHREIAKMLLDVAAKYQCKERIIGKDSCKTLIDDSTEAILATSMEPLWSMIRQYMKTNNQSQDDYKIEYLKTYHGIYPLNKKEKSNHKKENMSKESDNENKHEKNQAEDALDHEFLNSMDVKDDNERIFRTMEYEMKSPKVSQDIKNGICNENYNVMKKEKLENLETNTFFEEIMNSQSIKSESLDDSETQGERSLYRRQSSENKLTTGTNNLVNSEDASKEKENLEQNSSLHHIKSDGKGKFQNPENSDGYTTELQDNKSPLCENNCKPKKAHVKEELCKIIIKTETLNNQFTIKESPAHNEKDKGRKRTEKNKILFEENLNKMSKTSSEVTHKKSKSLGSDKNSKITAESKSAHSDSAYSGKQNKKGDAIVFGLIPYRLSDPKYIECGWTQIPRQYHMKKVAIFGVTQGKKNIFWCKDEAKKEVYFYPEGSVFSILREDGTGEIFYPDGLPAILVTSENNRIVTTVFSEGKANLLSLRVVGRFDSYGHGIIYDGDGKVRMQYTQTWGRVIDPITGKFMKWCWKIHLKDSIEKKSSKARRISAKSKKGYLSCLGEEPKSLPKTILCPIPFFSMKLNDAISFRLFEQHDMCLVFYANKACFRLEIGVTVDFSKEDFYELCIDHEKEKGFDITRDMSSIHDELMPPHPKLPRNLPRAPVTLQSTEERKEKTIFLHRAIRTKGFEARKSIT